jgi:hypothetical protein
LVIAVNIYRQDVLNAADARQLAADLIAAADEIEKLAAR